ncbi:hypothetical protein HYALB_00012159 [Hymenoscyphus albidus]|uniref:serine--tRNA ligase n=1 Tax=Hymenoscyphus albidus TaxID=595503 RepID=A0A9N9LSP7_9HELO|nr:hypothetical protein HYALB_00012159 [Hymenoscyphus albidus]
MFPSLAFPASTSRSVPLSLALSLLPTSPLALRCLLSHRQYHRHQHTHLALRLRLRPQSHPATQPQLQLQRFSSVLSQQSDSLIKGNNSVPTSPSTSNDPEPGRKESAAPSRSGQKKALSGMPWGVYASTKTLIALPLPSLSPSDCDVLERTCEERNYLHLAKFPREILRLRELLKPLESMKRIAYARRQAIARLLDLFRHKKEPPPEFLRNATQNKAQRDLVGMTEEQLQAEAKSVKMELMGMLKYEATLKEEIHRLFLSLPNLTSRETPRGKIPKIVGYINDHPKESPFHSQYSRHHTRIGTELELLDFKMGASTTGWGWYYLLNEGAQLEQALIQYSLSVARRGGWGMVSPPSMVNSDISSACGFQPRDQDGAQQVYSVLKSSRPGEAKSEISLAGTAEIPLAAMLYERRISGQELPKRHVAVSRCYRAEAGARGLSSKGLYRVHEFTKVEMFAWTHPTEEASTAIFDEIQRIQIEILSSLGLHCRILEMPSMDLGASATRKRDIEAFFPSRTGINEGYGEVTSVSTCTDYQTSRLRTRLGMKTSKRESNPYTVNGTALAVPRVLAAILENGWNEERREVAVPECLWPWMDGVKVISSKVKANGGSVPAAAVGDPLVAIEDEEQDYQHQDDQLLEEAEDDELTLEEQQSMTDGIEESDLDLDGQEGPNTIVEGGELPPESEEQASAVVEDVFSDEALETQPTSDSQTENDVASAEQVEVDELIDVGESGELTPSVDSQRDEVSQSTEETPSFESDRTAQEESVSSNEPQITQPTEQAGVNEPVADQEASDLISSVTNQKDEVPQSTEENQPAEPNESAPEEDVLSNDPQTAQANEETQTTNEAQTTEEAKPESPVKSLFSRFLGR